MTAVFDENGLLDITNFGAKGLFTAMFVALITVEYKKPKSDKVTAPGMYNL
jgi:cellobiose-specific phosphotransferase system component IIC